MKFKIRYADQIVGILAIIAIVALVVVIFMLGSKQRWFARDYRYFTTFETASGLSLGMPIQYKGFTIGKIQSIALNKNDKVVVSFTIFDTYYDRVRKGSVVELSVNPIGIGIGNQFLFNPGIASDLIPEGSEIPRADSPDGRALISSGLVVLQKRDDTIINLVAQIQPMLVNINATLTQMNEAFNGTGKGPLANTMSNISVASDGLAASLGATLRNVELITASLQKKVDDPKGFVPALVDPDGTMFDSIQKSLDSVAGTLQNLEDSSSIIKSQVPEIVRLIEDLRIALVKGQDVLDALRNNPILKNGVPERVQTDASGTNSRNIEF